ncbi:MAG: UDP-N-acetylmuramate dehydrogenase [Acidobacteriia bacterium]|nr:UDP-N-acetylmuramate dehydrogenase [Terriglobia bacterium]
MRQSPFPVVFRERVPLAPYTSLGIGGPARYLAEVETEAQVIESLEFGEARKLPVFILGGGSNIVASDAGFDGLVVRIALRGIRHKSGGVFVAAAGEEWDPFVRRCVEHGLVGIECLSGIPGTVGGTPVQNVGAYGQEVGEVIVAVRALDRNARHVVELNNKACGFAYRTSIFNTACRERYVVLSVTYALRAGDKPRVAYPDLIRYFSDRTDSPSLAEVREGVLHIRDRKSMVIRPGDPNARSAGSFFKNPLVPADKAAQAEEAARCRGSLKRGEIMPQYPMPEGMVKLSAAWLIENAGFTKGYSRGRVGLSSRHTLALINRGGATAQELLDLMRDVQSAVRHFFGVELVPEPVFVGFDK